MAWSSSKMHAPRISFLGPRHALRAQGRKERLAQIKTTSVKAAGGEDAFRARLLDYLSQSATLTERTILESETVASQGSSSRAARMLDAWLKQNPTRADRAAQAASSSSGNGSGTGSGSNSSSNTSTSSSSSSPTNGSPVGDEDIYDTDDAYDADESVYMPKAQYDLQEQTPDWASHREPATGASSTGANSNGASSKGASSTSNHNSAPTATFKQRRQVEVRQGQSGERSETFASGGNLVKDALGRVKEITSKDASRMEFYYDKQGHLDSFVRFDSQGKLHSRAQADKHGVIVRDAVGRVKAQGESMQVDPYGCVSIAREDGQFWSLDLVRSVHIERRLLPDEYGRWVSMTALFCVDGFRMATRFSSIGKLAVEQPRIQSGSGAYRFYGRDGSVIGFDSDNDLEQLKPNGVLPPGSKSVGNQHWGRRQAGTAWESLREYVGNYLAAL